MSDFFEIDFLPVQSDKSGDAIALRYQIDGLQYIHVVDGGFQDTGDALVEHIRRYYGNPIFINHVVATHPDGDHASGLRRVLEAYAVGALWMLRPWQYANEIIHRFEHCTSEEHLQRRLKELYPNIAALEQIAMARGIPIYEPFIGSRIGAFTVLAPTKRRYLDLIVQSEKTPEAAFEANRAGFARLRQLLRSAAETARTAIRAAWGLESFSADETRAENNMSVVQFAELCGERILLTGDAGRAALVEAAIVATDGLGITLPGISRFQVPHHGSRRNVSTEILDIWLGPRLPVPPSPGPQKFTAIVSSAKDDEDHPRKAVVRAMVHRGARVVSTERGALRTAAGAIPARKGWTAAPPLAYPDEQETD